MSELVVSRTSSVHGIGVFAIALIPAGTLVGRFVGSPTVVDGTHVLWLEAADGDWNGVEGAGVLRFLNHSRSPNVEFDGPDLYALNSITVDEELLVDYGEQWAHVL